MGARFIDDEEVATKDACMKLCCSTNDCDVFVFEEKVSKHLHRTWLEITR
jgi:MANEC domain